jgi:predicted RNA-binding Zn-ribbon protein involved in translation (DUF1610 family)
MFRTKTVDEETYHLSDELVKQPASSSHLIGSVVTDLPCSHCGYNLKGMAKYRHCPECGTPVGRSSHSDQLRYSDPTWLRQLIKGIMWIILGLAIAPLFHVAYFVAALMEVQGEVVILLSHILPMSIHLVGVWLVSKREPSDVACSRLSLRNLIRWVVVIAMIFVVIDALLDAQKPYDVTPFDLVSQSVQLISYIALFLYARCLAFRLHDLDLVWQTGFTMCGVTVTQLGIMLFLPINERWGGSGPNTNYPLICGSIFIVGACCIFFLAWSARLLLWYSRALKAEVRVAERV